MKWYKVGIYGIDHPNDYYIDLDCEMENPETVYPPKVCTSDDAELLLDAHVYEINVFRTGRDGLSDDDVTKILSNKISAYDRNPWVWKYNSQFTT